MKARGPIRVVFCHHTSDVAGGSDRSLFDVVTHLPEERFSPAIILKRGDPMAEAYREAGIPVTQLRLVHPRRALEWGKQARFFLSFWPSVFQAALAIRRLKADVVHVNTMNNLQGPFAAWLARRPLVWHIREIGGEGTVIRAMRALVARLATRVVAISQAVADTLGACGERVRIIPNGIDLSEYADEVTPAQRRRAKAALGLGEDVPVVSTIGRLEPWKGQHVFVEALPALVEACPGARVLIVGGPAVNKPEYAAQLEARVEKLGLSAHVTFTGIRKDIPDVLAASDVLVLPSAEPEPFGRTIVEAMAAGCPVVATAAGGPLETVLDGETGFLVPLEQEQPLAEKVIWLLAHPDEAASMGAKGRQRAMEHYALERLVRDMAHLFEEVCD